MSDLDSVNETLMQLSGSAFDLGNEILASRLKALAVMTMRGRRELTERHDALVAALREIAAADDDVKAACAGYIVDIKFSAFERADRAKDAARALLAEIEKEMRNVPR